MGTHVIELLSLFVMKQMVVFKTKVMDVRTSHSPFENAAANEQCEKNGSRNRTNNVLPLLLRPLTKTADQIINEKFCYPFRLKIK